MSDSDIGEIMLFVNVKKISGTLVLFVFKRPTPLPLISYGENESNYCYFSMHPFGIVSFQFLCTTNKTDSGLGEANDSSLVCFFFFLDRVNLTARQVSLARLF